MPNVGYLRAEYADLLPKWDLIRDCLAGEFSVKAAGTRYLPQPNQADTSLANLERYKAYLQRAVFYNVCERTLNGLLGQVARKEPVIELPPELDALLENVDGSGVHLDQQAMEALADVLAYGRGGLYVDYPNVETGVASRRDLLTGRIRPTITYWQPWDIINWRVRQIGAEYKLSLVVLSERYVTDDDGYQEEYDDMWRVLKLDDNGFYVVEEWTRTNPNVQDKTAADYQMQTTWMPKDSTGQPLRYIPFVFLGAKNNSEQPDLPLLYDLASLNIAHFRNSADYEDSCYLVGQPTPVFAGLTEGWVKEVLKGQVHFGSRASVALPEGGSAELLQAQPNSMPFEAMKHKEKQMVSLGARLIEETPAAKTATEAIMDSIGENSILTTAVRNVSKGYEKALQLAYQFISSGEPEIVYEMNTDFEVHRMDAQEQQALMALWQANAIVEEEMRDRLRKAGIAYLGDEEYKQIRGTEMPTLAVTDENF